MPQGATQNIESKTFSRSVDKAAAQSKSDMEIITKRMRDVEEGRSKLLTREEVSAKLKDAGY